MTFNRHNFLKSMAVVSVATLIGCTSYEPYCHFTAGEIITLKDGVSYLVRSAGQGRANPSCLVRLIHSDTGRELRAMTNERVIALLHENDPRSSVVPIQVWRYDK